MKTERKDNSEVENKAELRRRFLPEKARVLDLFCGTGQMYQLAYQGRCIEYHGVDKGRIHSPHICTRQNNVVFVNSRDITKYNIIDLDDYGSPWALLFGVMKRTNLPNLTVFLTDGLVLRQKRSSCATRFVSATERIRSDMRLPGFSRFYVDMFGTMLKWLEKKSGYKTIKAVYFHNKQTTVYYWALKMKRLDNSAIL